MADKREQTRATEQPPFRDNSSAPFVYFDLVASNGVFSDAIQIELASRILAPRPDGGVDVSFAPTGRLRCSPTAAIHLRNSLNQTLAMMENGAAVAPANQVN
jgi:hypothetical protein